MPCSTQCIPRRQRSWITTSPRILWALIRLPVVTVLLALEPLVSLVLVGVFVLGTGTAVILRLSGDVPEFHFWGMTALSFGNLLALSAYRALIGLLCRSPQRVRNT